MYISWNIRADTVKWDTLYVTGIYFGISTFMIINIMEKVHYIEIWENVLGAN